MYKLVFKERADEGLSRLRKAGEKQALKKVAVLLEELRNHPTTGTGKPERLKHENTNRWSRRITEKHRLVYDIFEHVVTVEIIQTYGHYEDN